ncbi:MAG: maleylacetoacetate isomerase [Sphingosinicella sp.]|nr:maleylacetoacetate isomerase [Sphingosinicella sp.]
MTKPVLFDYYRSSASYRVRIALNMKAAAYESVPVDLVEGQHRNVDYLARNPQGLVPMLEVAGRPITQSLAIIDYLDGLYPEPALLPADPLDRAHVMGLALIIACDTHPLNNLRVLKYLSGPFGRDEAERNQWYGHWVRQGLAALEAMAAERSGKFLFGDSPGLADIFLVPQMYNARRFNVALDEFPLLVRVDAEACGLEAFAEAHPDRVAPVA